MDSEKLDCKSAANSNIQLLEQILHMNEVEGECSYATKSTFQKKVISEAKHLIEESIADLYSSNLSDECLKIADLGCSSGPNAYLPTWDAIEALHAISRRLNRKPPKLQVFLNDLPGNDFNGTFKLLPTFYQTLKVEKGDEFGECFIAAVPGSFYGRLFPSRSLHFVFSSYSLHWLSQVPKGLVSESGILLNKDNVYLEKTSPPIVHKAYLDQFANDFTTFLESRAKELKFGGRMVLVLNSDSTRHPNMWEVLGNSIKDLVSEGLIEESKLASFDIPFYGPSAEEIMCLVLKEGNFSIHKIETRYLEWFGSFDDKGNKVGYCEAEQMSTHVRAISESLVSSHFGNDILDEVYKKFSVKLLEWVETGMEPSANLLISLMKK